MMNRVFILIVLIFSPIITVMAQHDIREQVFVHLNSRSLISGETLYLSAYCNSQLTGRPSPLSKILYVEIVGESGAVHQQKVLLNEGRGSTDFFISSAIPSGQYHLIAYTRWMKNFDDYFHCPVLIINPYESYPNELKGVETDIEFYPLHDPLVAGVENIVAFHLKGKKQASYKGRVLDNAGEVLSTFDIGKFGVGKFKLTPRRGRAYQVVLEDDQGNISFHELPAVATRGSFVVYKETGSQIELKCELPGSAGNALDLTIQSGGSVLYRSEVVSNEYHVVPDDVLSQGVYRVHYSDSSGATVAERVIYIPGHEVEEDRVSKSYGTRQKVTIETGLDAGDFSVSVRKKADFVFDRHYHAVWRDGISFLSQAPAPFFSYFASAGCDVEALMLVSEIRPAASAPEAVELLPEIREEILTGSIVDELGNPVAAQKVALTFPGKQFQLRVGESDESGKFFIPFQSTFSDAEAILSCLDFQRQLTIKADSPYLDKYPDFDFQLPYLDSSLVRKIMEKSIRVQLENAYLSLPQRQQLPKQWVNEIPYHEVYLLDDYKRFSTLKETFTEYVITANVRESRDHVIKTTFTPGLFQKEYPPLVLLDGVPVSGGRVVQLNPYKVESIGVLPNRYFLGPLISDGIVGIRTFEGDCGGLRFGPETNHLRLPVAKVAIKKEYNYPEYTESADRPQADQRDQLFWEPAYKPRHKNAEISFYTSDVQGEFEVVIEGFTDKGKPVTRVIDFRVE